MGKKGTWYEHAVMYPMVPWGNRTHPIEVVSPPLDGWTRQHGYGQNAPVPGYYEMTSNDSNQR